MNYSVAEHRGDTKLYMSEKKLPPLNAFDVVIKVHTATICGTDINILKGNYYAEPPVVLGHEYSGIIEAKGSKVTSVEIGDLVTVEPHLYCGICKFCRIGKEHLCVEKKAFGVHIDGGFAQYNVVPEKITYKVPTGITATEAALTENIGCCLHGIEQANIKLGDDVVVLGGGFVGIVLAELAKLQGASKIIVVEPDSNRRELISNRGFQTIDPLTTDLVKTIMEQTNGLGADIVIEAAGKKETAQQCFDLIGRGGTILFFGVVPPREKIDIYPNDIYKRELKIVGSAINPFSHYRSLEILKYLNLNELVTHHFMLEEINKALEFASKGTGIKIAIHPNGDLHE